MVGVLCKDGIILGAEKLIRSKLLVSGTDQRIYNIDSHVGMVYSIAYHDDLRSLEETFPILET